MINIETYKLLTGNMELYQLLDDGLRSRDEGTVKSASEVIANARRDWLHHLGRLQKS